MTSADFVDTVVVGAGVVGLAVARALAAGGHETMVLERHPRIGEETSSRNSGVIHSGIYYPPGSLKARLCVRGRDMLYAYCKARGIAHRRCGKLIIAQRDQSAKLDQLHANGVANGVTDLQRLDGAEVRALEPELRCAAGLLSPSTGIIDVHEFMLALLGDLEAHGGMLVLESAVEHLRPRSGAFEVTARSGGDSSTILARHVINSAGLSAVALARRIEGLPAEQIPPAFMAKGNYFSCPGRPFRHLVYPMPNDAGLGVHATLDLDGTVRFGPDVEWVDAIDYHVDPVRTADFCAVIRDYWPGLPDERVQPAYAGIRPKIVGPGQKAADFLIEGPERHGMPGLYNLFGIESPGLTAALAIGEHLVARVDAHRA